MAQNKSLSITFRLRIALTRLRPGENPECGGNAVSPVFGNDSHQFLGDHMPTESVPASMAGEIARCRALLSASALALRRASDWPRVLTRAPEGALASAAAHFVFALAYLLLLSD